SVANRQFSVDLSSLSTQQLSQVKKQLDDEIEHLTNSHGQLRQAQAKFRECIRSIAAGVTPALDGKPILVPLTTSLYVPGTLADPHNVIVDVGTGFYVEKNTKDATKFYEAKVEELGGNLRGLEAIVQGKSKNLSVVEDVLREKVLQAPAPPPFSSGS
ncbi:prefoldin subunit, partial [Diplocarpon rosae]